MHNPAEHAEHPDHYESSALSRPPNLIARLIFASRWLQFPIYLGLILVQVIYAYKFMKGLWQLIRDVDTLPDAAIMLAVLNLIDVVMIANLLLMVIIGGYETFVSKLNTQNHPDQPEWLNHVNASVLKVKLSMAIISISSIHMLQTFINAAQLPVTVMMWQLFLHLGFLASALAMALTDRILYGTSHKSH